MRVAANTLMVAELPMVAECPSATDQFEELYALYHEPIYRYLYRLADRTDLAGDLTHDVFFQLHRQLQGNVPWCRGAVSAESSFCLRKADLSARLPSVTRFRKALCKPAPIQKLDSTDTAPCIARAGPPSVLKATCRDCRQKAAYSYSTAPRRCRSSPRIPGLMISWFARTRKRRSAS